MSGARPESEDRSRSERLARNEIRLREINEGIRRDRDPDDDVHHVGFVCECAQPDCTSIIPMTPAEYEELRAAPTRFVVVDGHQLSEAESTVRISDRYAIVEKREPGAEIARATDPRR